MTMTKKLNIDNGLQDWKTEHQAVTGVCCQWRTVTAFLTMTIFATEQQPPIRYMQPKKTAINDKKSAESAL